MPRSLWPRRARTWVYVVVAALVFLALDVLSLRGFETATGLLVSLAGLAAGAACALCLRPLILRSPRDSMARYLWFFGGIASLFVVAVGGSALAGIPLFPTAEGGRASVFIYGLAFGFGNSVAALASGGVDNRRAPVVSGRDAGRVAVRVSAVVAGTVIGLVFVCLLGYASVEYIVTPLVRSFIR